jgi:hypothetical protein
LERFLCRLPDGRAQFEIRDVLVLPPIGGGKGLLEHCGTGDAPERDVEIIGYGRIDCSAVSTCTVELEHAWRANRTSESFEELPLEGITCWVEGEH